MPPRLLFRRFLAFFVDYALAAVLALLCCLPFATGPDAALRLSTGPVHASVCQQLKAITPELATFAAPAQVQAAKLCKVRPLFVFPPQQTVTLFAAPPSPSEDGQQTSRRPTMLAVPVDGQGRIDQSPALDPVLSWIFLWLASGLLLRAGRSSPGKRLMGLRLIAREQADCAPKRIAAPIRRESLRLLPLLGLALAELTPIPAAAAQLSPLLFPIVGTVFIGWYYLWPLFRWQGAMRHDKWSGFYLDRA